MADPTPTAARRLPRALTPFRHPAYRRLAVALTLSTFASGVWIVALVWEVIRIDGGPAQLSVVATASAVGVLLPALLGGVVADRVPQKLILLVVAGIELAGMTLVAVLSLTDDTQLWHLAAVSFVTGHGDGVLLPGLLRVAARTGPESDLHGGQRLRGHDPARPSARRSARAWPAPSSAVASPGAALAVAAAASLLGAARADGACPCTPVRRDFVRGRAPAPRRLCARRHARGLRLHGAHAVAAGHAAVRVADDPGDHGSVRGADPVPDQGPARRRPGDHAWVLAAFGIGGAVGSLAMASFRMPRRYLT